MRSLEGKTVLITRPRELAEKFESLLKAKGAECIRFSTIEIVSPVSWNQCDDALDRITEFDGLIFTSVNAVEYFFRRCSERSIIAPQIPVYVIGEKTFETAVQYGATPVTPPLIQDSRHLAEGIVTGNVKGKKFLFPKGDRSRTSVTETIVRSGGAVAEIVVYRSIIPSHADTKKIKELLLKNEIDIVTFFSGSSVDNFIELISTQSLSSTFIAVNGRSAGDAVKLHGLMPHIEAGHPAIESMADALEKFFRK